MRVEKLMFLDEGKETSIKQGDVVCWESGKIVITRDGRTLTCKNSPSPWERIAPDAWNIPHFMASTLTVLLMATLSTDVPKKTAKVMFTLR